jgi:hypothetical protein
MNIKDKCQEIADAVQARLCGLNKAAKLYGEISDKDERIRKLTEEIQQWKEKFDSVWKAWHNLALETKGDEEVAKMIKAMKDK